MSATQEYLNLCCREQWEAGVLWNLECRGDALLLPPDAFMGLACLKVLDSGESAFRWERLKIRAELPDDCALRVYARAADQPDWPERDRLGAAETPFPEQVRSLFGPPAAAGTDVLLGCTGRYLWLVLELAAGGAGRPRIDGISLRIRGDHMVDYLPAIYQEQDFTYRYLSIFNSMLQDLEGEIDAMPRLLDVHSAPPEMLRFLAGWLCVEPEERGPLPERLPQVLEEYEGLYTVEGVKSSVRRLTGRTPEIVEHFAVDPNDPACRNPALYRRLYGENPYRFFLLLPNDTFASRWEMERFLERMKTLVPAETELELVLLKPCIQLDWHTYLGVNSRIGSYIPAAIDETAVIHYDTTIGGRDHE